MLRNKIYYRLKPFIPTALRLAIRKRVARWTRKRTRNVWPIMPGSERPPRDWPGWPNNKKFALVLTHDVEGPSGLADADNSCNWKWSLVFAPPLTSFRKGAIEFQVSCAKSSVGMDLKWACTIFSTMVTSLLHGVNSPATPLISTTISMSGAQRDSGQASCCTIWTGSTIWTFNTTLPLSIRIRLSHNRTGVTQFFLSGFLHR